MQKSMMLSKNLACVKHGFDTGQSHRGGNPLQNSFGITDGEPGRLQSKGLQESDVI